MQIIIFLNKFNIHNNQIKRSLIRIFKDFKKFATVVQLCYSLMIIIVYATNAWKIKHNKDRKSALFVIQT